MKNRESEIQRLIGRHNSASIKASIIQSYVHKSNSEVRALHIQEVRTHLLTYYLEKYTA